MIVAATDRHQVQCGDTNDGKLLWTVTTGGRVDSPPTLVDDLCIFGGREVEIFKRVYPARAVPYYKEQPQEDIADATWLRSANNNGLLSRRVESVGRHDGNGVSYAKLIADKIAIGGDHAFATFATDDESDLRVASTENGEIIQSLPLPARPARPVRDGIALADGRIFVTCRDGSQTCFGRVE